MMQGYDKDAAVAFITRCIRKADHPELAEDIPALVPQMIDADMAYMHEAGVLDDDGYAGDAYYEDDEAIEYIVESLAAKNALDPEQAVKLAALVDDYLDAQQMFWNRRVWLNTTDFRGMQMGAHCVAVRPILLCYLNCAHRYFSTVIGQSSICLFSVFSLICE